MEHPLVYWMLSSQIFFKLAFFRDLYPNFYFVKFEQNWVEKLHFFDIFWFFLFENFEIFWLIFKYLINFWLFYHRDIFQSENGTPPVLLNATKIDFLFKISIFWTRGFPEIKIGPLGRAHLQVNSKE